MLGSRRDEVPEQHQNPVGLAARRDNILSMIPHRLVSGILGLVLALGGFVAGGYIPTDLDGFTPLSAAVGVLVPGVLMLSAFYLAFRLLKFAALARK